MVRNILFNGMIPNLTRPELGAHFGRHDKSWHIITYTIFSHCTFMFLMSCFGRRSYPPDQERLWDCGSEWYDGEPLNVQSTLEAVDINRQQVVDEAE